MTDARVNPFHTYILQFGVFTKSLYTAYTGRRAHNCNAARYTIAAFAYTRREQQMTHSFDCACVRCTHAHVRTTKPGRTVAAFAFVSFVVLAVRTRPASRWCVHGAIGSTLVALFSNHCCRYSILHLDSIVCSLAMARNCSASYFMIFFLIGNEMSVSQR